MIRLSMGGAIWRSSPAVRLHRTAVRLASYSVSALRRIPQLDDKWAYNVIKQVGNLPSRVAKVHKDNRMDKAQVASEQPRTCETNRLSVFEHRFILPLGTTDERRKSVYHFNFANSYRETKNHDQSHSPAQA